MSTQDKKHVRKKKKFGKVIEYVSQERTIIPSDDVLTQIEKDALKAKAITAQALAEKYNIAVSTIKPILYRLEQEGKLKRITSTKWTDVFSST